MIVLLIRLNGIFLRYRTSYVSIIARNYIAVVLFTLVTAYSVQYLDYRNESKIFHRDITLSNFPNLENSHVRESTRRKGEKVFLQNFLPSPCSKFFTLINSRFYGYRDHGNSHFKRKLCTLSLSLSKIRCSWCARSIGRPIWKLNVPAGTWDFLARVFHLASRSRARASHSDPRCSSTSFRAPRLSCISINPPWHANNFVEKIERPMRRPRTLQLITWPRHDRHTASGYRTHNLLWLTGSTASRERIGDARFFCARILSLDRTHPIRVFFPSRLDFQRSRWILKGPPPIQWRIPQQFPLLSSRLPAFDRLRNFNVIPIEISVYLHFESLDCFEIVARLRGYVYLIRIGNL